MGTGRPRVTYSENEDSRGWSTRSEANYLQKLGKSNRTKACRSRSELTRLELLINYRESMGDRVNWGTINVRVIRRLVDELIEEESGCGQASDQKQETREKRPVEDSKKTGRKKRRDD